MYYITGDTHGEVSRFIDIASANSAGRLNIFTGKFGLACHNHNVQSGNINTMSTGTFMYVRTECDHGKRLHLTVYPDQGIYTGLLIEE